MIKTNQSSSGFTLIETMIAIMVLGISVTTIFGLQAALIKGVFSTHAMLERVILMKNFLVDADKEKLYKKDAKKTKTIEDPDTKLIYKATSLKDVKSFSRFKSSLSEKVTATWQGSFGETQDELVSFKFNPEKSNKAK